MKLFLGPSRGFWWDWGLGSAEADPELWFFNFEGYDNCLCSFCVRDQFLSCEVELVLLDT